MPKHAEYCIDWRPEQEHYVFSGPEDDRDSLLFVNGEIWQPWLEEHHAFAFHGRNGHINLLKEPRSKGEQSYWYAYRRWQGRVHKCYVGQSSRINLAHLENIAARLCQKGRQHTSSETNTWTGQAAGPEAVALSSISGSSPGYRLPGSAAEQAEAHRGDGILAGEFLLRSKLQLPYPQRGLLLREPLLEQLEMGLACKVTLIAGAAGYGKTTLVGQWISSRSTRADFPRIACVTLDEDDNDPISFWRYLIAACQQLREEIGREALEQLSAHRLPSLKPLNMMLISLLNDLNQLEQPCVLILDDLQRVHSPSVIETFSFFLEHVPPSFHLFLLTRGEPAFSLVRLRAHNEVQDITLPSLRFSLEETGNFFARELSYELPARVVRLIYERLEGWPAGLRLFVQMLRWPDGEQDIEQRLASFTGNSLSLQEYFLQEILQQLPADLQEFLLQTSVLPRLSASCCAGITEQEQSTRQIELLRSSDLFLVPLDWDGTWSRYYPLFAEAMQHEARKRLGETRLRELAERASRWYEAHGFLPDAITTALNASAYGRAAELLERFLHSQQRGFTFSISEMYGVKRWLDYLPEEELERRPELCVAAAMTLLLPCLEGAGVPRERQRINSLLDTAERHQRNSNDTEKLAALFSLRALLARLEGNILQAVTWAKQALNWLPAEERAWRNLALRAAGIGEMLDGNLAQAQTYLLEALHLSEQEGDPIQLRAIRERLSQGSIEQGELRLAAEQLHQIQQEARQQGDRDDIARTQSGLAQIRYQWNELDEAEQAANEALALAEQLHIEEVLAPSLLVLTRILYIRGQSTLARQRLLAWLANRQTPITPQSYQFTCAVQIQLARLQLADGDLESVKRWLESYGEQQAVLPHYQQRSVQLLKARYLLAQDALDAAREILERLDAETAQSGHRHLRMEIQAVLLLVYARQQASEQARQLLCTLVEAAWPNGYLRLFLDEGAAMADLLRELLRGTRKKALLASIQSILRAFQQPDSLGALAGCSETPLLPTPLSLQERKVLELLVAGNSNGEIASALIVSVNTVRTQVQSIYRKLNVNNRVQASTIARRLHLV